VVSSFFRVVLAVLLAIVVLKIYMTIFFWFEGLIYFAGPYPSSSITWRRDWIGVHSDASHFTAHDDPEGSVCPLVRAADPQHAKNCPNAHANDFLPVPSARCHRKE
jgi:hypothetical protein